MGHLEHTDIPVTDAEEESFEELLRKQIAEEGKLTAAQQSFVDADKYYHSHVKPFLDEFTQIKKALVEECGVGVYFQDREGTVYKTESIEGKFVHFLPFDIKRTRRRGETKGSLSMTEAREAGFVVEGK